MDWFRPGSINSPKSHRYISKISSNNKYYICHLKHSRECFSEFNAVTSPRLFKDALEQVRSADKTLTRWMRENGLDLFEEYGSRRLNLRELSAIVRSANLTNDQGGPLTEATISKTWARQRQRMLTPRNVLKPGELVAGVVKLPGHEVEPLLTPKPVVSPNDRLYQ